MESKDVVRTDNVQADVADTYRTVSPLVDIYENDEEILLRAEMPGVEKDKVSINIDNGHLTLSGIRSLRVDGAASWEEFGPVAFRRAFSVPQSIDVDKVQAKLGEGVLVLHLPKSEAAKPHMVKITAG